METPQEQILVKKRHWFLTLVLVYLILSTILSQLSILINTKEIKIEKPSVTDELIILHTFSAIIEIFCLFLIFKWKKNAFFTLGIIYVVVDVYIAKEAGNSSLPALLGIYARLGILYLALKVKKNSISGWMQLE
jgi:hypothetical protein